MKCLYRGQGPLILQWSHGSENIPCEIMPQLIAAAIITPVTASHIQVLCLQYNSCAIISWVFYDFANSVSSHWSELWLHLLPLSVFLHWAIICLIPLPVLLSLPRKQLVDLNRVMGCCRTSHGGWRRDILNLPDNGVGWSSIMPVLHLLNTNPGFS